MLAQIVLPHDSNLLTKRECGLRISRALPRELEQAHWSNGASVRVRILLLAPLSHHAGLVSGILASQASWKYSAVCCSTIVGYSAFTLGITQWRTKFRKQMIALENEASAKVGKVPSREVHDLGIRLSWHLCLKCRVPCLMITYLFPIIDECRLCVRLRFLGTWHDAHVLAIDDWWSLIPVKLHDGTYVRLSLGSVTLALSCT